ncbi:hypothetical protein FPV67DRAFT_1452781 [Lyophyllum atratum]|nr:hypothetical protein FPV67DRAFT_1452781 [Lyophyllum atratum]
MSGGQYRACTAPDADRDPEGQGIAYSVAILLTDMYIAYVPAKAATQRRGLRERPSRKPQSRALGACIVDGCCEEFMGRELEGRRRQLQKSVYDTRRNAREGSWNSR